MIRRSESIFSAGGNRSLFRRSWVPLDPDRAVVLVHGLAEHSGRYDHFGDWFARRGCAVHAYDQQGHGESPGLRGHLRSFEELVDDLAAFVEHVRTEHPDLPVTVVGHSMGGLVVASYACERKPDTAGVVSIVTSGAALALSPDFSRGKVLAARVIRRLLPRLSLAANLPPDGLSRDPEVARRYVEDPLVFTKTTASLGAELLDAIQRIAETGGSSVPLPMLLLHGAQDPMCPVEGSSHFFASLTTPGSDLRIYPELRHEIFNEPEQQEVFGDLLDWVVEREASSASA